MDAVNRLIQAGIRPDCAMETVFEYEARGDLTGLEQYIRKFERKKERR